MTNNKLEIAPMTVTIDRLTVGGKQMTKSVFNQIQIGDFYYQVIDHDGIYLNLKKDMILGYVILQSGGREEKWYVWVDNGRLRKGVFGVSNNSNAGIFVNKLTNIIKIYNRHNYFIHEEIRFLLDTEEIDKCRVVVPYRDFEDYIKAQNSNLSFIDKADARIKAIELFKNLSAPDYAYEFYITPNLSDFAKIYLTEYMEKAQSILDYINDMQLYIAI